MSSLQELPLESSQSPEEMMGCLEYMSKERFPPEETKLENRRPICGLEFVTDVLYTSSNHSRLLFLQPSQGVNPLLSLLDWDDAKMKEINIST